MNQVMYRKAVEPNRTVREAYNAAVTAIRRYCEVAQDQERPSAIISDLDNFNETLEELREWAEARDVPEHPDDADYPDEEEPVGAVDD